MRILFRDYSLARIIYTLLSQGGVYEDPGEADYEERHQARMKDNLGRKARRLGYRLVAINNRRPPREIALKSH